jgi:hypothetical protein
VVAAAAAVLLLAFAGIVVMLMNEGDFRPFSAGDPAPAADAAPSALAPFTSDQLDALRQVLANPVSAPTANEIPWDLLPAVSRPYELGTFLAAPVFDGLAAAHVELEPCFDAEQRQLENMPAHEYQPGEQRFGPAMLMLELETRAGVVVIVSADLDTLGTSTPELVACAQKVLKGRVMPAPEAPPGERFRMRYVLQ